MAEIKGKTPKQIFEILELKQHTLYEVKVKVSAQNVEHKSFLFTGFKNGNYCTLYINNYEDPIDMTDVFSIEVVKKLAKTN